MKRLLVVNGDDFGLSVGVNAGILEAYARGIVTSASLMVRREATEDAARRARSHEGLSIGLHVDLGEWRYTGGQWETVYQVVALEDRDAVAREVDGQIDRFVRLVGRRPTHLDSHQHVHLNDPTRSVVSARGRQLGVPVRGCTPEVRFCGRFYGQDRTGGPHRDGITPEALLRIIADLPTGITELGCHPGHAAELVDAYAEEREEELRALCDSRVREAVRARGIRLLSYRGVRRLLDGRRTFGGA